MNALVFSGTAEIISATAKIVDSNNRCRTEIYKIQKATELSKFSIAKNYQKTEKMYGSYLNCARAALSSNLSNANKTKVMEKIIDKINCV